MAVRPAPHCHLRQRFSKRSPVDSSRGCALSKLFPYTTEALFAFSTVSIFALMWQRKWWVQCWWVNRGSGSNMDESSPPSHTQGRKKERKKKKSQFHWRMSLMKPEKVWHTKSQPRVFLTPQDEMGRLHTAPALHPKYDTVFGKSDAYLSEWRAPPAPRFTKHGFYLKERLANYGYSHLSMWQTFSWKWTK